MHKIFDIFMKKNVLFFSLFLLLAVSLSFTQEKNKEWYFQQGKKAYTLKDYLTARDNFLNALLLDTTDRETKKYLDLTLNKIVADEKKREDRINEILEQAKSHKEKGYLLHAADRYYFVLELDPGNKTAQTELGRVQVLLENTLEKGEGISPKEKYSIEGFVSYYKKEYEDAVSSWKKAVSIKASGKKFILDNRVIQEYADRTSKIVTEEKLRIQIDDLTRKGVKAYEKKTYHKARKIFKQVLDLDPENSNAKDYIKKCERRIEEIKKAREAKKAPKKEIKSVVEKKVVKDKKKIEEHYQQGLVYYASGQLESALKEFEFVLRLDPEHAKAKQAAGKIKRELQLSIR